jgi:hypothetical protein
MSKIPREKIVLFGAIALTNLLAACNNNDLNRLLNGSSASAGSTQPQRHYYGAQGTITQSEAPVLKGLVTGQPDEGGFYSFAQPQSRHAITSRVGFENSYQGDSSFYSLANGGEVEIVYDSQGRAIGLRQRVGGQQP